MKKFGKVFGDHHFENPDPDSWPTVSSVMV